MKPQSGRRRFLQGAAAALGAGFLADHDLEAYQQNVNTNSRPSDLKITDMRIAVVARAPMTCPIIRIDTNRGIYGLGEVRDGAGKNYALLLKSRLLNENPCNVDRLFRRIKQFGNHSRQGGGVGGVEMALWDLAGKAWNVPVYQMLGGRFRDRIRICADTTESPDPKVFGQRLKARMDQGYFLAMENHSVEVPWWGDLVEGVEKPIVNRGFITVPNKPGLGVALNDDVVKRHLPEPGYFEPTTQWNTDRSTDRWWS